MLYPIVVNYVLDLSNLFFFCHERYRKGGKQALLVRQLKM